VRASVSQCGVTVPRCSSQQSGRDSGKEEWSTLPFELDSARQHTSALPRCEPSAQCCTGHSYEYEYSCTGQSLVHCPIHAPECDRHHKYYCPLYHHYPGATVCRGGLNLSSPGARLGARLDARRSPARVSIQIISYASNGKVHCNRVCAAVFHGGESCRRGAIDVPCGRQRSARRDQHGHSPAYRMCAAAMSTVGTTRPSCICICIVIREIRAGE
jgi:hypothetical protein